MAKFIVTEKTTVAIDDDWLQRLYDMDTVEVLKRVGPKSVKVEASDEIALRMAVGKECRIDRE